MVCCIESQSIQIVLGNLAIMISFNIISSLEHPVVLELPWFELHNLEKSLYKAYEKKDRKMKCLHLQ